MGYRYVPPSEWPPRRYDKPPVDDWVPPEHWEPKPSPPLFPSGEFAIVRPDDSRATSSGLSADEQREIEEKVTRRMLAMWARAVLADAHSYWQAAMRAAWIDRAIDYGEEWSPDESELPDELERVWVRAYKLIMSAYQMEQWLRAHRRLNDEGEEPVQYRDLRNAIEHLYEAQFTELVARKRPGDKRNWSIDRLPGQQVFLGFHNGFTEYVFGEVSLTALTARARKYRYVDRAEELDYEPTAQEILDMLSSYDPGDDSDNDDDDDD